VDKDDEELLAKIVSFIGKLMILGLSMIILYVVWRASKN
jgi:fumarate reductase subunit D